MFNKEVNETPNLEGLAERMMKKHGFKSVQILADESNELADVNLLYYPQDDTTFYQIICAILYTDKNKDIKVWRHKLDSDQWQIYISISD
jgi:hypothetical protein